MWISEGKCELSNDNTFSIYLPSPVQNKQCDAKYDAILTCTAAGLHYFAYPS